MKHFPVIIVGGGPAGSMAGYHLANAGVEVLILDKSVWPRRKVCGGGLTHRALLEIPFDISSILHAAVEWGTIASGGRELFDIKGSRPISYLVDRPSFDAELVNRAIKKGAIFHPAERVIAIKNKDPIEVHTNKSAYSCDYLIGADGVHSLVAKTFDLIPDRKTSLAYEARLEYPSQPDRQLPMGIAFDFGTIFWGYGWIFPKKDHLNVGVCRSWPMEKVSKKHLMRFINQHASLRELPIIDIRAYPVPLGGKSYRLDCGNLLLVGDAANLADPWLGEGLDYAITSGRIAVETIIDNLQGSTGDLSGYSKRINHTLVKQFKYARRFSLLVNALPDLNTAILKVSHTVQNMVIDLLRGEKSYQETWQGLKALFPRSIQKILHR